MSCARIRRAMKHLGRNEHPEARRFESFMTHMWGGVSVIFLAAPEEYDGDVQIAWEAWCVSQGVPIGPKIKKVKRARSRH